MPLIKYKVDNIRVDNLEYYPEENVLVGINYTDSNSPFSDYDRDVEFEKILKPEKLKEYIGNETQDKLLSKPLECLNEGLKDVPSDNVGEVTSEIYILTENGKELQNKSHFYSYDKAEKFINDNYKNNNNLEIKKSLETKYLITYGNDIDNGYKVFDNEKKAEAFLKKEQKDFYSKNKEKYGYSLGGGHLIKDRIYELPTPTKVEKSFYIEDPFKQFEMQNKGLKSPSIDKGIELGF
ncbi:MAG TPA: hypothetical protein QF753_07115 [Victivallales bacterium]|nr:hypothetical protein [Victivallales bacterium]